MGIKDNDTVFRALADPTRRRILDLLRETPRTTGELAVLCASVGRCAVMKHLAILEKAGLVVVRRDGRRRWNHLNPMPIQFMYDRWLARHLQPLARSLHDLKIHVERNAKNKQKERRNA